MKNVSLVLTLTLIAYSLSGQAEYDETKDKSVEFSLHDGEAETAFDYEDEEEVKKRQAELKKRQSAREKQIEGELAHEERLEKERMMKELRGKKAAEMKKWQKAQDERREFVRRQKAIAKMDRFQQLKMEREMGRFHKPAAAPAPGVEAPLAGDGQWNFQGPSRTLAVVPSSQAPSASLRAPATAGSTAASVQQSPQAIPGRSVAAMPGQPNVGQAQAPAPSKAAARSPQAVRPAPKTEGISGLYQKASDKIQGLWSSFKKLIWR